MGYLKKQAGEKISFKKKLVFSFFLFYMLPLILVASIGFGLMTNQLKQQDEESYNKIFNTTVDQMDNLLNSMQQYNLNMQNRPWLKSMIYMKDPYRLQFDRVDYRNFADEINGFTYQNDYIEHIFYYFIPSESFLTTTDAGIVEYEWFTSLAFQNELMKQKDYASIAKKIDKPEYYYLAVENYGRKENGILCCYPVRQYKGETICLLYFFVSENSLQKLLDMTMPEEDNWFYIEYEDEILLNRTPYPEEELKKMSMHSSGRYTGEKMIVFSRDSVYTGFRYYNIIPENSVYDRVQMIQLIFLLVLCAFVLCGFCLSYYAAIRNYQPVQELMKLMKDRGISGEEGENEFYWLQKTITELMDRRKNLDIQIEEQKPILRNAFLAWLLRDNQKPEETQIVGTAESIGLKFVYPFYNCLLCSLKAGNRLNRKLLGCLENYNMSYGVLFYQNDYVVILNYEKEETISAFYQEISDMLGQMEDNYFFGVGDSCESLIQLPQIYKQAKQARDFRMINRECGITFYSEVTMEKCYFYPIEKEYALCNCLMAGEYEKSVLVFNELLDQNMKEAQVSFHRVQNLFSNVKLTCVKVMERLEIQEMLDSEIENLEQGSVLEEYINAVYSMFRKLCEYVQLHRKSNSEIQKEILCQFVDQHLCDSNLSLNYVAEAFDLSDSYVSRLFKEKTGNNFLDYMNRARIEKAKMILLSQRETSIQEIGFAVGYNSDAAFRRIFKKYEGITPSQFRIIQ